MRAWTTTELDAVGAAVEVTITTRRPDGTLRAAVPIWVVRVGDDIYVRSYRGPTGGWYRHTGAGGTAHIWAGGVECEVTAAAPDPSTRSAIDDAYRSKYDEHGRAYVEPMVADAAAAATLHLTPTD
jgi:hypothetical protein